MSAPRLPERSLVAQPLTAAELARAAQEIYTALSPTPQIEWPLLSEQCGAQVWIKHENHLPTGAFKVRGGVWFMQQLRDAAPTLRGVVAATRGNHGQSVAFAAHRQGLAAVVVVPRGNNPEKNLAMRALGAELIEHGDDFNAALGHAAALAAQRDLFAMPSFHPWLVQGVGTYAYELLRAVPDLDTVYVPIGLGSGIAGTIAARDALGLATEVVGVVSSHADAYAQSFERGELVTTASADTLADGVAVRVPDASALAYLQQGVARIVRVSDDEVLAAMAMLFSTTHNLAEGAGAAPLAALCKERERMQGRRVALVLSGGNADRATFMRALGA